MWGESAVALSHRTFATPVVTATVYRRTIQYGSRMWATGCLHVASKPEKRKF